MVTSIEVEGHALDEIHRIRLDGLQGARICTLLIVVPDEHAHVQVVLLQRGSEVIADEHPLILAGIDAGIPRLGRIGLILHGQILHDQSVRLVAFNIAADVFRPQPAVFFLQLAAAVALAGGLHERRRTPGRQQQRELAARFGFRPLDEGDDLLFIMGDGEGRQLLVIGIRHSLVVADGEIAAVNRHAEVTVIRAAAEVEVQQLLLLVRRHLGENVGSGFRRCAAQALEDAALLLLVQVNDVELIPDVQFPHFSGLNSRSLTGQLFNACFHTITSALILLYQNEHNTIAITV